MEQLLAAGAPLDDVTDVFEVLHADRGPAPDGRPWVSTNMVMSADGSYTSDGLSGGLSSPGDKDLFMALRALSDVVLAGASTVRKEGYHRPRAQGFSLNARHRDGQEPAPTLVVVSRSMDLGTEAPVLSDDGPKPIMAHPRGVTLPPDLSGLEDLAAGDDGVDMVELMSALHSRGVRSVICEGGPHLLGQLAADDLIDEYNLTLAPTLVGGTDTGLLGGFSVGRSFHLHRVLRDGDHLMLCYRRH